LKKDTSPQEYTPDPAVIKDSAEQDVQKDSNVIAQTLGSSTSKSQVVSEKRVNNLIVKVPVVLDELTVRIKVDFTFTLPEPAYEIKTIKKRLKLTQCLLIQDTNVLFIKGFVRKNIDYSNLTSSTTTSFAGNINHFTVDVPFSTTTDVNFSLAKPTPLYYNTSQEFEFFRTQPLPIGFPEKDNLLAGDFSEFNQTTREYFNELPFCELVSSKIVEYDEALDRTRPEGIDLPFEEGQFTQVEEKMVIFITFKLLQNQQVYVPQSTR
jgi:hypothetical protein